MRKVKDAVDLTTNEKIYFKGHAKATYLSDGRNVEEALAEMPSAESDVFKAIYGETTYEEAAEAYAQGKVIHCDYEGYCYVLASFVGGTAWFVSIVTHTIKMLYLSASGWNKGTYYAENTGNRVTTIDANSTDVKYPSAKAVYDFVNNTLGTIINGDY